MHFKHSSHSHSFTQFIWQNNNVSLLHLFICPFGNSRHITDCFVTIDLKCKYKIDSDCSAESAVWKNFHWNYLKKMQTSAKNVFIEKKRQKRASIRLGRRISDFHWISTLDKLIWTNWLTRILWFHFYYFFARQFVIFLHWTLGVTTQYSNSM